MNRKKKWIYTSVIAMSGIVTGCDVFTAQETENTTTDVYVSAFSEPVSDETLEILKNRLPKDGDYYIVDGDILLTDHQLRVYLLSIQSMEPAPGTELIVMTDEGARVYWVNQQDRRIPYAVDRRSFPDEAKYDVIVENMEQATSDWESTCPSCGIDFIHVSNRDDKPVIGEEITFIVRYNDVNGAYIAAAFFPNYAESRRYVNIDPSYFSTSFNRTGVLRHELGHVLGYRHEHIQGISGCRFEDDEWEPLTEYDSKSVMHYLCGGGGDRELAITETDRLGHQQLYGQ